MIATKPTDVPTPGVAPDLIPELDLDPGALMFEATEQQPGDVLVGVPLGELGHVYVYAAPTPVHVGSMVIVPASWFAVEQTAEVSTLDPPRYPGPVKRVLAVLS